MHLDGLWRPQLRAKVSAVGGEIGPLSIRAGFLLTSPDWHCPSCLRPKLAIIRRTERRLIHCRIVHHHDHTQDIEYGALHGFSIRRRFETAAICEDCNLADAAAKKMVRAPDWFSFSPREIGYFCESIPNTKPRLQPHLVRSVWSSPVVQEHVRLVETAERWFELYTQEPWDRPPLFHAPFARNSPPTPDTAYIQDGYLSSFKHALKATNVRCQSPEEGFKSYCHRSGGTTRG